jgi:hypothetical protein
MRFRLIEHALERALERGATEKEIEAVLVEGESVSAKKGRMARQLVFDTEVIWLGRTYPQKKIMVIYVEQDGEIVVITVKVYYGCWR